MSKSLLSYTDIPTANSKVSSARNCFVSSWLYVTFLIKTFDTRNVLQKNRVTAFFFGTCLQKHFPAQ
jgi:hypothetical protein